MELEHLGADPLSKFSEKLFPLVVSSSAIFSFILVIGYSSVNLDRVPKLAPLYTVTYLPEVSRSLPIWQ